MDVCREKVIARFLNEFEELYEGFVQYGSLAFVKQAYEKLLVNRGERVRVLEPGREWTGRALGITDTGELIVEAEDGEIRGSRFRGSICSWRLRLCVDGENTIKVEDI